MAEARENLENPTWLELKLRDILNLSERARAGISMNNARLMDLDKAADRIDDPTRRAAAKARIKANVARQARIAGAYRGFAGEVRKWHARLQEWLTPAGIKLPAIPGLGDVGVLPAVPIAIGVGIVAAAGVVASIIIANGTQQKAIENDKAMVDSYTAGRTSFDDLMRFMDANRKTADQSTDALGIKGALQAAVPVLALIAGVMILPTLLESFRGLRRATA